MFNHKTHLESFSRVGEELSYVIRDGIRTGGGEGKPGEPVEQPGYLPHVPHVHLRKYRPEELVVIPVTIVGGVFPSALGVLHLLEIVPCLFDIIGIAALNNRPQTADEVGVEVAMVADQHRVVVVVVTAAAATAVVCLALGNGKAAAIVIRYLAET